MSKFLLLISSTVIGLFISNYSSGADNLLYQENYEGGVMPISVPKPVWSIKASAVPADSSYGPGNLFEVVSGIAHTGKFSLRFNYDGRNGFCNTCGNTSRYHISGLNGVNYFVDSKSANLALDPIKASAGRIVYNKTDGFSKWRISSVLSKNSTNDQLTLEQLSGNMAGGGSAFSAGDQVNIMRVCGIDGIIGGDINRRSDCNQAITYMDGVSGTQNPGESIFRRVYLMVGKGTVLPYNQKLHYWTTTTGNMYLTNTITPTGTVLVAYGGEVGGTYDRSTITLTPGIWYYIEEEFKAETSDSANDGVYRVWVAKSGDPVGDPLFVQKNLNLGVIKNASLWGNHQHHDDSHGFWYMDDIAFSKSRIGPIEGILAPPNPPTL